MNSTETLYGIATVIFATGSVILALGLGDGIRRWGRSYEIHAEVERDAFDASMELEEPETIH